MPRPQSHQPFTQMTAGTPASMRRSVDVPPDPNTMSFCLTADYGVVRLNDQQNHDVSLINLTTERAQWMSPLQPGSRARPTHASRRLLTYPSMFRISSASPSPSRCSPTHERPHRRNHVGPDHRLRRRRARLPVAPDVPEAPPLVRTRAAPQDLLPRLLRPPAPTRSPPTPARTTHITVLGSVAAYNNIVDTGQLFLSFASGASPSPCRSSSTLHGMFYFF